jgi:dTDP-4-amino-4,6-dideoxygalactose transaminase
MDPRFQEYKFPEPIHVTRPTMPSLEAYYAKLQGIWSRQWLTNKGKLHEELEGRLAEYLDVKHLSLVCNGTIALMLALDSLDIHGGEVITTPFTFPATIHVLRWGQIKPVFCDVDKETFNLDPRKIEDLIGPETRAILPVHVFGVPCDVEAIAAIADKNNLRVIYDAAHAFGVKHKGRSIFEYGDMSTTSFHATKLFSTVEGGAIISRSESQKIQVDYSKNFGIADEETVVGPGINGKMNEFQSAFGLLQLENVDEEIGNRKRLSEIYQKELQDVPGIQFQGGRSDSSSNYSHFPILIDKEFYRLSRDELHELLKEFNIYTRKYFFPLCSHIPSYSTYPSAAPENLPVAERLARQALCLPLYGTLGEEEAQKICAIIQGLHRHIFAK